MKNEKVMQDIMKHMINMCNQYSKEIYCADGENDGCPDEAKSVKQNKRAA